MKFNIKVERVRSRWFPRREDPVEMTHRKIDEMYQRMIREMNASRDECNRMFNELESKLK
jgi:hypothetical protein